MPPDNLTGFTQKPINQTPQPEAMAAGMPTIDLTQPQPVPAISEAKSSRGFGGFFRANRIYFIAIFAALAIIGVMGFFAFRKVPVVAPKEANVSIDFSNSPQTATIGGEMIYHLVVTNKDKQ